MNYCIFGRTRTLLKQINQVWFHLKLAEDKIQLSNETGGYTHFYKKKKYNYPKKKLNKTKKETYRQQEYQRNFWNSIY